MANVSNSWLLELSKKRLLGIYQKLLTRKIVEYLQINLSDLKGEISLPVEKLVIFKDGLPYPTKEELSILTYIRKSPLQVVRPTDHVITVVRWVPICDKVGCPIFQLDLHKLSILVYRGNIGESV